MSEWEPPRTGCEPSESPETEPRSYFREAVLFIVVVGICLTAGAVAIVTIKDRLRESILDRFNSQNRAQTAAQRAAAAMERGDYDRAMAECNDALRLDPKLAYAHSARSWLWHTKGENDKAIADASEAIRLEPANALNYSYRGSAWSSKGDYDKAIADFDAALRLDPSAAHTWGNRGWAWHMKGEFDKALADYDEVLRMQPSDLHVRLDRGVARVAREEYDEALADFDEVIRLEPNHAHALNGRAWIYACAVDDRYRDGAKAVADATRACELTDWSDAAVLDTLAAAFAESGRLDKAVEWQEKAIERAPEMKRDEYRQRLKLLQEGTLYPGKAAQ